METGTWTIIVSGNKLDGVQTYLDSCTAALRDNGFTVELSARGELQPDGVTVYDDTQPFKCPGCGATYPAPVVCTNQHPGEQTLPTQDVLAGAKPTTDEPHDPTATPAATPPPATAPAQAEQPTQAAQATEPPPAPEATPVPPPPAWPS